MKGCTDTYEPECTGSWCREWGFCQASLQQMDKEEDDSEPILYGRR